MKCPKCKAKLLPVDGELFCLQCGTAVHGSLKDNDLPTLEDTSDPLLQKAITDSVRRPVHFKLPVSGAQPVAATTAFTSMHRLYTQPASARSGQAVEKTQADAITVKRVVSGIRNPVKPAASAPRRGLPIAWGAGIAAFALFVVLNVVITAMTQGRAYPGVKIGTVPVGGLSQGDVERAISRMAPSGLNIVVGSSVFKTPPTAATVDASSTAQAAFSVGRNAPLPLLGVLQSFWSKPVALDYSFSDQALADFASKVERSVQTQASPAHAVVIGAHVYVLPDKPGQNVSQGDVLLAVKDSFGRKESVQLPVERTRAVVEAGAYAADATLAQAFISGEHKLVVKNTTITVDPLIKGSWVRFGTPGAGITLDAHAAGEYLNAIKGTFDRPAALAALSEAAAKGSGAVFAASGSKNALVPIAPATDPGVTYTYCSPDEALVAVESATSSELWGQHGVLRFVKGTPCNIQVRFMTAQTMKAVGGECARYASCHDDAGLILNAELWTDKSVWASDLPTYQRELVGHELGHWLGFEHSPCTNGAAQQPAITSATVQVPGCSPTWYSVPNNTTKNWNGLRER
jgi:hypothetical protein